MIKIKNLEEMQSLAEELADKINFPITICLSGDLGAGKTSFSKFFIKKKVGQNIEVTSPTFSLIHEYENIIPIAHLDLYRLNSVEELYQLGIEDYMENYIVLIEWPELAKDILPKNYIFIDIIFTEEIGNRIIKISSRTRGKDTKNS